MRKLLKLCHQIIDDEDEIKFKKKKKKCLVCDEKYHKSSLIKVVCCNSMFCIDCWNSKIESKIFDMMMKMKAFNMKHFV